MKKEQKQEWDANTLCIPYYHSTILPTGIHNACREGWSDTVNREIFVFKNLRVINFRVKKSSSASGSDEDFLTTKFF